MNLVKEKILELQERRKHIELGSRLHKKEKQPKLGKLTIKERLNLLFDKRFYHKLFQFAKHNTSTKVETIELTEEHNAEVVAVIAAVVFFVLNKPFNIHKIHFLDITNRHCFGNKRKK